jgi:hypothetical protein
LFKLLTYLPVLPEDRLKLRMYCFRPKNALGEDQEKHHRQRPADGDKAHRPQYLLYKLVQTGIHCNVTLKCKKPPNINLPYSRLHKINKTANAVKQKLRSVYNRRPQNFVQRSLLLS